MGNMTQAHSSRVYLFAHTHTRIGNTDKAHISLNKAIEYITFTVYAV